MSVSVYLKYSASSTFYATGEKISSKLCNNSTQTKDRGHDGQHNSSLMNESKCHDSSSTSGSQAKKQKVEPDSHLPFDTKLIQKLISDRFRKADRKLSTVPPMHNLIYDMEENFVKEDQYWISKVRPDRFDDETSRVLYRPVIVNEMMALVDKRRRKTVPKGIMVKGPQGIGKSFSIVNLVLRLMSTGKYLVTFIPDCKNWEDLSDFYDVIFESLRIDDKLPDPQIVDKNYENLKKLIKFISDELDAIGVKWVFIFDQINSLFARFEKANDFNTLPFPFKMIDQVGNLSSGLIISIISASANNELSYKERHPGFDEFNHPTSMEDEEVQLLYTEQLNGLDMEHLRYLTAFVPFYVKGCLNMKESQFIDDIYGEVEAALEKLKTQCGDTSVGKDSWKAASNVIIALLLGIEPKSKRHYDRKFSYFIERAIPTALFPLVQSAYRQIFWREMIEYVDENEVTLLQTCNNKNTDSVVRGGIFEQLVIMRFQRYEFETSSTLPGLTIPSCIDV